MTAAVAVYKNTFSTYNSTGKTNGNYDCFLVLKAGNKDIFVLDFLSSNHIIPSFTQ